MKKFLSRTKFVGPSFNSVMKLLTVGLIFSFFTTVLLQFAMHFQVWGRRGAQSTDMNVVVHYVLEFLTRSQMVYSVLACLLLFIFIVVLVNRLFIGTAIYSILAIIAVVAEYMKMSTRNEPIILSDMAELTAVSGLTKMIDKGLLIGAIIAIAVLLVGAVLIELYMRRKRAGVFAESVRNMMFLQSGSRLGVLLISFGLLATPFVVNADQNKAILYQESE